MHARHECSGLIEMFCREAYAEASWAGSLRLFCSEFEASHAAVLVTDATGLLRVESSAEPQAPALVIASDPLPGLAEEAPTAISRGQARTQPEGGQDRLSPWPAGIAHVLGLNVRAEGGSVYAFRLFRPAGRRRFSVRDIERCRILIPHVRTALNIRRTIVSLETERILLGRAVNRCETGVITLDRFGSVLEFNDRARAMLRESRLMHVEDRRLFLWNADDDQRWKVLLRLALLSSRDARQSRTLGAMPVHDPAGQSRLGILLRSIPQKQSAKDPLSPVFAVYLRDALTEWVAPSGVLRKLFGITAAEASLTVHIARGLSIQDAATEMAISPHTAKSHLQSVFQKLGISRQADLVRIAISSVAAIG